jgi:hypothetical protein
MGERGVLVSSVAANGVACVELGCADASRLLVFLVTRFLVVVETVFFRFFWLAIVGVSRTRRFPTGCPNLDSHYKSEYLATQS